MEDLSHYNPEGSVLRKAQLRMLEMLDVFDAICRKHSIDYWLVCGTLLGARRHGGFIPWDDDLDIYVLQRDHKKLLSVLKEDLPENLKLQARGTDEHYWYYYPKIRDTRSRLHHKEQGSSRDDFEYQGVFIDIFLIEPVPSLQFKKTIDKFLFSEMHFNQAKSLFQKMKYSIMYSFTPFVNLFITLIRMYYKYISNKKEYSYAFGIFFYATYNIDDFFPVSEIMFEGKKYKAPHNVDSYLTDNFNADFMVVPKPEKRKTHASKIDFF